MKQPFAILPGAGSLNLLGKDPALAFSRPPILVVGEAASGKTTTIQTIISHAIGTSGIKPENILVIANDVYGGAFEGATFSADQALFPRGVKVVPLLDGCACCEDIQSIISTIASGLQNGAELVVIEGAPGAEPAPLLASFAQRFNVRPHVISLLNADEAHGDELFAARIVDAASAIVITRANQPAGLAAIKQRIDEILGGVVAESDVHEERPIMVESSAPTDIPEAFFRTISATARASARQQASKLTASHDVGVRFGLTVEVSSRFRLDIRQSGDVTEAYVVDTHVGEGGPLIDILSPHARVKGFMYGQDGLPYYINFSNDLSGGANLSVQKLQQAWEFHNGAQLLRLMSSGTPVQPGECATLGLPNLNLSLLSRPKFQYPDQSKFLQRKGQVATSWRTDSLYLQGHPFVALAEQSPSPEQIDAFKESWQKVLGAYMTFRLDGLKLIFDRFALNQDWGPRAAVELGMDVVRTLSLYGNPPQEGGQWFDSLLYSKDLIQIGRMAINGVADGGIGVADLLFRGLASLDALPKVLNDLKFEKVSPESESFGPEDPDLYFFAVAVSIAQMQGVQNDTIERALNNVERLYGSLGREQIVERWQEFAAAARQQLGI